MHINKWRSERIRDPDDQWEWIPPIEQQNQFFSLFQGQKITEEEESRHSRGERLEKYFAALLLGTVYQDKKVRIDLSGKNKLCWRLLSGPLQGCTLLIDWSPYEIAFNFCAPETLADKLQAIKDSLISQLNKTLQPRLITIKVTCES
jgi:hypothetical protein